MLAYNYAIAINNDLYLQCSHFVASNLQWKNIAGIRTCRRMDDTLHRCSSDTSVDANCDAEESKIAVLAGKSIYAKTESL